MKITTLEMANVKRIKALRLVPTEKGLTIIGGRNGQGKTSVLDAIAYGMGGGKYRPTNLRREGAVGETFIHIETDNGFIIDRKEGERSLKVRDAEGKASGQKILDKFISELSIDLPKFHNASSKEKAVMLLKVLHIDEVIAKFENEEKAKFDTRTVIGRQADQKEKAAKDMPWFEDMPEEPVSVKELIEKQQAVLARNGVKAAAKEQLEKNRTLVESYTRQLEGLRTQIATLEESIATVQKSIEDAKDADFTMESTEEIEREIADFEETNRKINANAERTRREQEADTLRDQYEALTKEIEDIRSEKMKVLEGAEFPLDGLSVENGELVLNGKGWDCMSGAQQLIVDCAIASKINPECKFILLDKLEQLDLTTLKEFGEWLEAHDLQCIATRVSSNSDGECSIVIEDGEAEIAEDTVVVPKKAEPAPLPDYD